MHVFISRETLDAYSNNRVSYLFFIRWIDEKHVPCHRPRFELRSLEKIYLTVSVIGNMEKKAGREASGVSLYCEHRKSFLSLRFGSFIAKASLESLSVRFRRLESVVTSPQESRGKIKGKLNERGNPKGNNNYERRRLAGNKITVCLRVWNNSR